MMTFREMKAASNVLKAEHPRPRVAYTVDPHAHLTPFERSCLFWAERLNMKLLNQVNPR